MRSRERIIALILALLALSAPSAAVSADHAAHTRPHHHRRVAIAQPDTNILELATQRALQFWDANPCPTGLAISFTHDTTTEGYAGLAYFSRCQITLSDLFAAQATQARDWPVFCALVTHEIGHLVLGPKYFQTTDVADPSHSTNAGSIMFRALGGTTPATCLPAVLYSGGRRYTYSAYYSGIQIAVGQRVRENWYGPGDDGLEPASSAYSQ